MHHAGPGVIALTRTHFLDLQSSLLSARAAFLNEYELAAIVAMPGRTGACLKPRTIRKLGRPLPSYQAAR